ncbi:unnamed protein product [Callosobruchus maculatus]|uniref:Uncharacterized protein n=1 Tax=Callosobruchus maculatus TaxID=64391 RepID=A0A653CC72_CALMS|nr:unnamed protein product [Callosobruchus maculatus]
MDGFSIGILFSTTSARRILGAEEEFRILGLRIVLITSTNTFSRHYCIICTSC